MTHYSLIAWGANIPSLTTITFLSITATFDNKFEDSFVLIRKPINVLYIQNELHVCVVNSRLFSSFGYILYPKKNHLLYNALYLLKAG